MLPSHLASPLRLQVFPSNQCVSNKFAGTAAGTIKVERQPLFWLIAC